MVRRPAARSVRGGTLGGGLAALVLLLVAAGVQADEPSRDLNAYVLFGYQSLSFKGDDAGGPTQTRGLIIGGHVGVNAVDPHDPISPMLSMCGGGSGHRVWMSDGSQVVADTARLQSPCNLYSLFVNRLDGGSPPVVRSGPPTAFAAPIINPAQLPAMPALSPGTTAVTVNSNTITNLAPGAYGVVRINDDGTLNLAAGTYQLAELSGGKQVHINTVDGTVLLIATEFGVNNDAVIGPGCAAQIWVRSDGQGSNDFSIHFSKHSEVHGQFYAPNGIISLGDDTDLFGRFIGSDVRSGWNTNVTYCGGGAPPPSLTPTPAATATSTSTATPTATATGTQTRTATATASATATATPIPTASSTATPPPTATFTATATVTETPTETQTPTITASATATNTTTPIPAGGVVGEVFDDGTAQPLAGAQVWIGGAVAAASDADGRYAAPALAAGARRLLLDKAGYTRGLRSVEVSGNAAARVRDARLTTLAAAVVVGASGATLTASPPSVPPAGAAPELIIAPGALPDGTAVRVTTLGPQGLIAPPPLGWSVLLGVDLQTDPPPAEPASATLRVPSALLVAAAGAPVTAAYWDDGQEEWIAAPSAVVGSAVEVSDVPFALPVTALPAVSTQVALLVADSIPAAPPAAIAGQALGGVSPPLTVPDRAAVRADPPVIVSGSGAGAAVLARVDAPAPLSSGTRLEAHVRETYDLLDGRQVRGTRTHQDIAGYQYAASATGTLPSPGALGAAFALVPSRSFGFTELHEGHVLVDVGLPAAGDVPGLIDGGGGVVTGPGGVSLTVPSGAVSGPLVIDLQSVDPGTLPAAASGNPDLAGAVAIDISGGRLDASAAYALGLDTSLSDGRRFAIARAAVIDQRSVLILAAFGHSAGGNVVFDTCPAGLSGCLAGLAGSGTYAVFEIGADDPIVTGTVSDATGPRAGLVVASDASPIVSLTGAAGDYALFAAVDASTTFTCTDRPNDRIGSSTVAPVSGGPSVLTADITLGSTPPRVTQIDPPNHASDVSRSAVVTVTFSEPLAAATVSDASVRLLRVTATGEVPVDVRRSLNSDAAQLVLSPASLLEPDTLYRVELTDAITDRTGTALGGPPAHPSATVFDFTTAFTFSADVLPPNTMRVSLPDADNRVFICGGPQLAVPGTLVDVVNDTTGEVVTVLATDTEGVSGSDVCDTLFPGRCDTSQPGSFCGVVSGLVGERVQVQVEDPLGNLVMLDAGNMRDERTGAEAIGPEGGVVTFPGDARYQALVPAGAFDQPTVVQITPITAAGPGLALADFPVLTSFDQTKVELIGAVKLDFEGRAARNLDISVPAPADAAVEDQYITTRVINFRGFDEQTMVDEASFAPDQGLVISGFQSDFPLITSGGIFGVHKAKECLGYVTGWVTLGSLYNDGYIPAGVEGAQLPFPVLQTDTTRWAVPLPCNNTFEVKLLTTDDQEIDGVSVTVPDRRQFVELPRPLTGRDNGQQPSVTDGSVEDGETDVDPRTPLQFVFDEPVSTAHATLTVCACVDAACTVCQPVEGTWVLSPDGQILTFEPRFRLGYGRSYRVSIAGVVDERNNPMGAAFTRRFGTFTPTIVGHIAGPNARDVVTLDQSTLSVPASTRLIAIADGRDLTPPLTELPGATVYDVSALPLPGEPMAEISAVVATAPTAGIDRSLAFVAGPPITVIPESGGSHTYGGPFLMTVHGPGDPDRFGVWQLFDLGSITPTAPITLNHIATRFLNQSANSFANLNSASPDAPPPSFLKFIDNEIGVPVGVAAANSSVAQAVYVANTPFLGIQAINLSPLHDGLNTIQVDGRVTGTFRAVAILENTILAAGEDQSGGKLVLLRPELVAADATSEAHPTYALGAVKPLDVAALPNWPTRRHVDGVATVSPLDLAAVACSGGNLCVVPIDGATGDFAPALLDNGAGKLRTPGGRPRGVVGAPDDQLLFVADGTAGLTIIDAADPGASVDLTGPDGSPDGIDDRVLAQVPLNGATALRVAYFLDAQQRPMVAVAAGEQGVYLVQVGPPQFNVKITQVVTPDDDETLNLGDRTLDILARQPPSDPVRLPHIQAKARIEGIDPDPTDATTFTWDLQIRSDFYGLPGRRGECKRAQKFVHTSSGWVSGTRPPIDYVSPSVPLLGAQPFEPVDASQKLDGHMYGGDFTLTVSATIAGHTVKRRLYLQVRGENPGKCRVVAALPARQGLPTTDCPATTHTNIYRRIACKESTGQQFNAAPDGGRNICPLFSSDLKGGVGIGQITYPPAANDQFWDWYANALNIVSLLREKLSGIAKPYPGNVQAELNALLPQLAPGYRSAWNAAHPTDQCGSPAQPAKVIINVPSFDPCQAEDDAIRGYNGYGTGSDPFGNILHEFQLEGGLDPAVSLYRPDVAFHCEHGSTPERLVGDAHWRPVLPSERPSGGPNDGDPNYVGGVLSTPADCGGTCS